MRDIVLFLSVFAACFVEGVEALTIVLAVGVTRGWRSTWYGVGAALLALSVVVAALGPALTAIPINSLRLVIGSLLLIFGLQWLRKAVLRAGGLKALHDETAIFAAERDAAERSTETERRPLVGDWYSFTIAFKGVLLEGLEVAFIVVTFGANQHSLPLAVVGAIAAVCVVVATGVAVREPLSRVPENGVKFAVGIMLTSFGMFWSAEGAGASWPGGDGALPVIVVVTAVVALCLVGWLRRLGLQQPLPAGRVP